MTAFLEKTLNEINDNIKFAETKNAALITLNSALIVAILGRIFNDEICVDIINQVMVTFVIAMLIPLMISIFSFWAVIKNNFLVSLYKEINSDFKIKDKFMFYFCIESNYKNDSKKYLQAIKDSSGDEDWEISFYDKQLASQIVDLSCVAYNKFALFNVAIFFEFLFIIIAFLTSLVLMILIR